MTIEEMRVKKISVEFAINKLLTDFGYECEGCVLSLSTRAVDSTRIGDRTRKYTYQTRIEVTL